MPLLFLPDMNYSTIFIDTKVLDPGFKDSLSCLTKTEIKLIIITTFHKHIHTQYTFISITYSFRSSLLL